MMAKAKPKPKPLTKRTIGKVCRQLQKLYKQYTEKTIPLKELRATLLYLIDNFASVTYSDNVLKVQTEDIVCDYQGSLGPAVIIFKIEQVFKSVKKYGYFNDASLKVRDVHGYRFAHRHVFSDGNGILCRGRASGVLLKSFQQGRLDDFFDIVQQVLRT